MDIQMKLVIALMVLLGLHSIWSMVVCGTLRKKNRELRLRNAKTNAELNKVLPQLRNK